jgi:hypothetical protein
MMPNGMFSMEKGLSAATSSHDLVAILEDWPVCLLADGNKQRFLIECWSGSLREACSLHTCMVDWSSYCRG